MHDLVSEIHEFSAILFEMPTGGIVIFAIALPFLNESDMCNKKHTKMFRKTLENNSNNGV